MAVDAQHRTQFLLAEARTDARLAIALIAAVIAFAVTAFAPQVLNDGDTFLHIAAGARMLREHAVLYRDPFSYTFANAPWHAHEWLAEIIMAAAYQFAGWSGLQLLFALCASAAAGFLAHHLGRWTDWPAQAIVTALAMSCMTASLLARPHLLALPLLELWIAGLVMARSQERAPTVFLLPLMAIWANIHASFLLGLALAGAFALEAIGAADNRAKALRGWVPFCLGAGAAALLNPHFLSGVVFPLALMGSSSLGNIGEWRPLDFSQLQPLELVVFAAIYFFVTRGVRIPPWRALISLGLLYMAFQHQRHQIVFAIAAPLVLAPSLSTTALQSSSGDRGYPMALMASTGAFAALLVLAALRLVVPTVRNDGPVAPITALAHVPREVQGEHVLNDYSFGGYLIFAGVRPFVDSRAELYGDAFLKRYAQIIAPDPGVLRDSLRRYDIRWTILSRQSPVAGEMDALAGWHRLYTDNVAVVHIRDK